PARTGHRARRLGARGVRTRVDFFALGGHSLLAAKLAARVRTVLDAEFSIADVFEAPTVAALAPRLVARHGVRVRDVERPRPVPASAAQRGMWLEERLRGPSASYALPFGLRLTGALDPAALRAAFADVVARHEALRTLLVEGDDGLPVQRILDPGTPVALTVADARAESPERRAAIERDAASHVFDIAADLPVRGTLVRTGDEEWSLTLLLHHAAADEWSFTPLLADLARAYEARRAGEAPGWEPLPVQYADYAAWERATSADLSEGLGHWERTLSGLPQETVLPFDRPRPAEPSHRGGLVPFRLPAAGARRLARATGTSVFMVLHAAVAALLQRSGAGDDIALGTPIAARADEDLAGLVGVFVNPLVLRTDLSGDPAFTELLERVRAADLAAFSHADVPFERVVERLAPERSLARNPLFQVMIVHQRLDDVRLALPGVRAEPFLPATGGVKFDLDLYFAEGPARAGGADEIEGFAAHAEDLFDAATVEGLLDDLARLLDQVTEDPGRRLSALGAPVAHPDTARDLPVRTVAELVEAQAARTPDATALVFGGTATTYAELDRRAEALADRLAAAGAGPERVVGIALPRSDAFAVALLAVLKTGAACLPIDLAYPRARVDAMLDAARPLLVLGRDEPPLDAPPRERPDVQPGHLAYVVFTSGSTGAPKAVAGTQEALANRLAWGAGLTAPGVRVAKSSPAFIDGITELLGGLVAGDTVVIADEATAADAVALGDLVERHGVRTVTLVPSLLAALVERGLPPSVTTWISSGEALPAALAARVPARLVDLYGCSEAAGDSLIAEGGGLVPIANTRAYVLDAALREVPAGELYLAGDGLARGYLGDPARTAERFVANPFGPPGSRLYRTGDRVRRRRDGGLDFLGRADDQISLRGFRIEPGEVEAALTAQDGVRRAAVAVHGTRLVGYVTGDAEAGAVLDGLRARLPAHLVPAEVVVLDELPATPNGKTDRRALPEPGRPAAGRAPATEAERVLARLAAAVLGRDAVGADDDFFRSGGDSIGAALLVARARRAGLSFTVRDVFRLRTVEALARAAGTPAPVAAAQDGTAGELPLSPLQEGLLFHLMMAGEGRDIYVQQAVVSLSGPVDPARMADAARAVLEKFPNLRAGFRTDGDRAVQFVPDAWETPWTHAEVSGEDGLDAFVDAQRAEPFDPAAPPLIRFALASLGEHDHRLVLTSELILLDGWSGGLLVTSLLNA
ncbi:condensation domain-containing protein, partial [Spirillospora sp. NPDC046719]